MDETRELAELRRKLDELWRAVFESGKPTAAGLAALQGWKPGVDDLLKRLDERVFALGLEGLGKRLDRLERQQDKLQEILMSRGLDLRSDEHRGTDPSSSRKGRETRPSPPASE
jgi:hypothetical protein